MARRFVLIHEQERSKARLRHMKPPYFTTKQYGPGQKAPTLLALRAFRPCVVVGYLLTPPVFSALTASEESTTCKDSSDPDHGVNQYSASSVSYRQGCTLVKRGWGRRFQRNSPVTHILPVTRTFVGLWVTYTCP